MNKDRRFAINMLSTGITLLLNLCINFFLSKYIVNYIGIEAYGFVSLANSIVNYATIITIALNSVAGRFISVSYHKDEKDEASSYFNSVFAANLVLALFFVMLGIYITLNLEKLIHIPEDLVVSVKNLFIFVFLNYILSILSTVFTVAMFITNKLYISSLLNAISLMLKVGLFYVIYSSIHPSVVYVGLVSLICTAFVFTSNIYFTHKLLPDIIISPFKFSLDKVKTLLLSGVWSSIIHLSQTLSDGLDLLISNLLVSPLAMGQLSAAKILGTVLNVIVSNVSYIFTPQLTYYYAKGDTKKLLSELRLNMLITSALANIPVCILFAYGEDLIKLWMPFQDANVIYALLVLTIFAFLNSPVITGLYNVFLITNHLKVNSLFWLCVSTFNITIVFVLLNTTSLGVYAITGVSTATGFIANFTFVPLYAAKCLKQKKNLFYPIIFRYTIITAFMGTIFWGIRLSMSPVNSWIKLVISIIICGAFGLVINYLFLFVSKERQSIKLTIICKIKRRGLPNE